MMKINVEIDCTPEEARSFLGLPDVKPVQAALMSRLEQQMQNMMGRLDPSLIEAWLPAWSALGAAPPAFVQRMMQAVLNPSAGGRSDKPGPAGG